MKDACKDRQEGDPTIITWQCTDKCKHISSSEEKAIIGIKQAFDKPIHELRNILHCCDNCPYDHATKPLKVAKKKMKYMITDKIKRKGHPLQCHSQGSNCQSTLRVVRAFSAHYPGLRTFLRPSTRYMGE